MSLLKQLLISVTVAVAAILVGTLALSIGAARQYLDGQLQSEADNAASSLALSLSQPANQDPVTQELLMMALFDAGQFRRIALTSPEGHSLFERERQKPEVSAISKSAAPQWFVTGLPLHQPKVQRVISDGWKQVGQLSLEVDNSYASQALWASSVRMAGLVLLAGLAWAVFVISLIKWFRRVLKQEVAAQVQAIGQQLPPQVHWLPLSSVSVSELQPVFSAIAITRERVQATEQEQRARIESLELEVNRDPVTLLPNRKYFVNELRRTIGSTDADVSHGYVMLFRQRDLLALNAQMTRVVADAWLKAMGEKVNQLLQQRPEYGPQLARLNGSDFVVLMPALAGPQAMSRVLEIRQLLQSMRLTLSGSHWCRWSFALTDYTASSSVTGVLSRLDYGLMKAESSGQSDVEYVAYGDEEVVSNMAGETLWRQMLIASLEASDTLSLAIQPLAFQLDKDITQRSEASLTLTTASGELLMGSLFLPVAVRLGMSGDFDLRAVVLGLEWLSHQSAELVVRISLPSLAQSGFLGRLTETLKAPKWSSRLHQLCLEVDAHGLAAYPREIQEFCRAMAALRVGVGLRRLDQQPMALTTLHALPLRYVKLGAEFAEQSVHSLGAMHLLDAMTMTAQQLGIQAVVTEPLSTQADDLLRKRHALTLLA